MNVPDALRYTADHEWVERRGALVRVGITDYAQDALGDVVFVQLPPVGSVVQAGAALGEVESTKSVSDVFTPLSGVVATVNTRLDTEPQLLNSDPYGEGWLCEIESTDDDAAEGLLDAEAYRALIGG